MVGSIGERMLRSPRHTWTHGTPGTTGSATPPAGLGPLLETIAQAEAQAGRARGSIEPTVSALVAFPDAVGRVQGDPEGEGTPPLSGEPADLAASLRALAAMGVGHVQLVLDPITVGSIEALAPTLERLDAG